jgi:glycine/D-amino acid oxidase-like deaminating enzyme
MKINKSPWVYQLDSARQISKIKEDLKTEIVIVGAGIAGIATAFFLLKNTDKKIVVIEKSRIARGATGHNAGQIVSYFERPFHEIVDEFGLKMSIEGQVSIENAWELFDEMYTEAGLSIPFSRFTGYDGLSTHDQVLEHLKNNILRVKGGLAPHELQISDKAPFVHDLPSEYKGMYEIIPSKRIYEMLETDKREFVAVSFLSSGVTNSALFTEHVAKYLQNKHASRFSLFEETPMSKVILHNDKALLDCGNHTITADRVVLCTNGFENIEIINKAGLEVDKKFHHLVNGVVGRMSGYLERMNKPPGAICYYIDPGAGFSNMTDPYFYLTRRGYEYEKGTEHSLVCLGGPQHDIPDREEYLYEFDYPDEVQLEIDKFAREIYSADPHKKIEYQFTWHGLMGYTPNRIRLIGEEPKNKTLLYNLGCNGVGILPSIYGGKRISQIISGEKMKPSIFDPRE